MKLKIIMSWILRIAAAVILLQTLYFKFSAHPESVAIFSKLGVEPWGRIGTGVMELITGILLLIPATAFLGGLLGIGLMSGAIGAHVLVIGIESAGDGGQLFAYAIIVFVCCFLVAIMHRRQATTLLLKLKQK
jgi:putative oxidoreductase